ncbi:MAG: sulfatase [Acidobacteriota bacterium]
MKRATLALLAAAACLGACREPTPRQLPALRFIEEATPPELDLSTFVERSTLREWTFAGSGFRKRVEGWRVHSVHGSKLDSLGWWLRPQKNLVAIDLQLEEDGSFEARNIDLVTVTVHGRGLLNANLHWAEPGSAVRRDLQMETGLSGPDRTTYTFRVSENERWRGVIGRLQVSVWTTLETPVCLRAVRLQREAQTSERLTSHLAKAWRAEIDNDQRVALGALPGYPVTREIEVPPQAELRFDWGAVGELPGPVRFRAVVENVDGGPGEEAGEASIFEAVWDSEAEGRWHEARADLAPHAGRALRLRLEVESEQSIDPLRGLPLFAHPEVLAPESETLELAGSGGADLDLLAQRPNIVLVVLDTLRADRLSLYGHHRPTSPHLEAWAERRAAVFEAAVASAGWTLPSHVSIFTGLDPHRHGVNWPTRSIGQLTMLAERLHSAGYATSALTGGGYLDRAFGLDQGFERYRSWARESQNQYLEPPETLRRAVASLEGMGDRPFFLFVQTYAAHTPYHPWQPHFDSYSDLNSRERLVYMDRKTTEERLVMQRRTEDGSVPLEGPWLDLPADQYDSGIARLDGLLRPLLTALDTPRLRRRTVVVITSDHGEMLGERDSWQHGHLYDPVLLVPLLIASPDGSGAGARIESQVSSVDLVPTLLELAGLPAPRNLDGHSLVPLLRGEPDHARSVAWSYGSRTDGGLVLRIRNRLKLVLRDSLRSDDAGTAQPYAVGLRAGDERDLEAVPAELRPYAEEAKRQLLEHMPGLRLSFSNLGGERDLEIDVESDALIADRVKVPDLSCACVESPHRGLMRVRVPPGERFTAILVDVREAQLWLTVRKADGQRQRLDVDLLGLDRPLAFPADGEGWRVEAGAPPQVGVGVWWNRASLARIDDPSSSDEEVLKSLRALGYVE